MKEGIGHNIKTARESHILTQSKLAELIGIAQTQLARYERDGQDPSATMVKRIAKALGIDPGELLK